MAPQANGRPDWDEYYMRIALDAARRSTCLRHHVGAIIVKDRQILATGYNGAPRGFPHCETIGCLREQLGIPSGEQTELCNAVHAEQNAIIQAAVHGVSLAGGILYTTHQPCIHCSKMIINARLDRVVYGRDYSETRGLEMMRKVGIEVVRFDGDLEITDLRE
ncbi:MAG: cytidine/deoxycytidylate deaminase family protein [Candidatus Undinarchaeales archaeon]|jgi:dCMP deaminase|nr:cytidine/deoxycytidylate deaminase family protein [Candidatus Undinarchaeales archaeon]MDP7491505.1 cytidine/deoxycytidylate deaminase family protein [Candidatus Undinarchaeales archaeon]